MSLLFYAFLLSSTYGFSHGGPNQISFDVHEEELLERNGHIAEDFSASCGTDSKGLITNYANRYAEFLS